MGKWTLNNHSGQFQAITLNHHRHFQATEPETNIPCLIHYIPSNHRVITVSSLWSFFLIYTRPHAITTQVDIPSLSLLKTRVPNKITSTNYKIICCKARIIWSMGTKISILTRLSTSLAFSYYSHVIIIMKIDKFIFCDCVIFLTLFIH